jgi:hypothetical protein
VSFCQWFHVWTAICTSQSRSSIIAVLIYGLCENLSANGLHKSCFEPKPWPAAADLWSFVSLRNAFMVESKHEMVNLMLKHLVLTVFLWLHMQFISIAFFLNSLCFLYCLRSDSFPVLQLFFMLITRTLIHGKLIHMFERGVMLISLLIDFPIILLTGRIIRIQYPA